MPRVRFTGFAPGSTVTMSASQGGVTRGPETVMAWGTMPGGDTIWDGSAISETLTVTVDEYTAPGDQFAPLPVEWRIRVTGTSYATPVYNPTNDPTEADLRLGWEASDPSFQRCTFVVHTGDSGDYRNDWVGHPSHRNKAFQYGQNCGHVYSEPGTYTGRSIYVYDDEGNWGTLALDDLVVMHPDDAFDAASTIILDPTAQWGDAPLHATANRCTTLHDAIERHEAIKATVAKGTRICARAGSVLNEKSRNYLVRNTRGRCLVDTFGGSDRVQYSERGIGTPADGVGLFEAGGSPSWAWTIKNWSFDMGYDVTSGPSAGGWTAGSTSRRLFAYSDEANYSNNNGDWPVPRGYWFVYDNVDATGVHWGVITQIFGNNQIEKRTCATFINDCHWYDNNDYHVNNVANLFVLGSKFTDTEGNDIGAMGRARLGGGLRGFRAHPIFLRETNAWTIYIRACYMENRGGWSGGGAQDQNDTGFIGGQRTMRINNQSENSLFLNPDGSVNGRGRRVYICDSVIMGTINLDASGSNRTKEPVGNQCVAGGHVVVENCLFVYNPQAGDTNLIKYLGGRKSLRNNMLLVLNTPYWTESNAPTRDFSRFEINGTRFSRFLEFVTDSGGNDFTQGDTLQFLHNTMVMLRPTAELDSGDVVWRMENSDALYTVEDGHNIRYAPNVDTPVGPAMDTVDLPAGMRVLDVWLKFLWEKKDFTLASGVADGADTPAIEYPVDWYNNPTTGADYAGTNNNNAVEVPEGRYAEVGTDYPDANFAQPASNVDAITVVHDCDASGVVQGDGTGTHFKITNRSGVAWSAGACNVILDRGSTAMASDELNLVDQTEFKLYRPTAAQPLDAGVKSTLFDFGRNLRPNAGFAISPTTGTNAAGALLPVN